jgi:signal transduction histidine kinase
VTTVILFSAFGLLLGGLAFWMWQQRQQAERQARMNEQLATMGREVRSIAHDMNQLFSVILPNLQVARDASPDELPDVLRSIERAAETANTLLQALKGHARTDPKGRASAEGIVRLAIAMLRSQKTPIHLEIVGVLHYCGADIDALRVVQNLLFNAVREAARSEGEVHVELSDDMLRVTNPLDRALPARLWEAGVSGGSSSGLGLSIARDAASKLGWRVRHELNGKEVSFVVTPQPSTEVSSAN